MGGKAERHKQMKSLRVLPVNCTVGRDQKNLLSLFLQAEALEYVI